MGFNSRTMLKSFVEMNNISKLGYCSGLFHNLYAQNGMSLKKSFCFQKNIPSIDNQFSDIVVLYSVLSKKFSYEKNYFVACCFFATCCAF